jgi:hypothetical protein
LPASERLRHIFLILVIALTVGLAYTTLHEGGHALAGLAFGGRVTDFNVNFFDLGAHVGLGGDFSRAQNAVINVSGVTLPLLAWLALILLLPRRDGFLLLWTKIILSMGTLNTLLAWIILPILALNGNAPPGDDVTRFLSNSGLHPLAVAAGAALLYIAGWTLFLRRTGDLRQGLTSLRLASTPGTVVPRRWLVIAGLVVLAFLVLAILGFYFLLDGGSGPQGYSRAAQVDLSERAYENETLYRFTAQEGELVGISVHIENIDTPYLDLILVGADGQAYGLLHGQDFSTEASDSQGSYGLATGEAQIVLTSQASPGTLTIYVEETP